MYCELRPVRQLSNLALGNANRISKLRVDTLFIKPRGSVSPDDCGRVATRASVTTDLVFSLQRELVLGTRRVSVVILVAFVNLATLHC